MLHLTWDYGCATTANKLKSEELSIGEHHSNPFHPAVIIFPLDCKFIDSGKLKRRTILKRAATRRLFTVVTGDL
jgi:hypothetical protein